MINLIIEFFKIDMTTKRSTKADKLISQYEERLRELHAIDSSEIELEEIEGLCNGFELEMNTLDTKKASILSKETRASIKQQYQVIIQRYRNVVREVHSLKKLLTELLHIDTNASFALVDRKLFVIKQKFGRIQSDLSVSASLKRTLNFNYDTAIQRLTKYAINNWLPADIRESIDLIRNTLAEPELYSIPHLIMWRKTAEEKIEKIPNQLRPKLPRPIEKEVVKVYKSLIKELKTEILKMRTYPIAEPWCSFCMREGVTHLIRGEFNFFVHPGIEEDIKPMDLSERDMLPGGLTRQEYDSRLNRVNTEIALAIGELEVKRNMESSSIWFEYTYTEIESIVNFGFTEIPLLYRDGRALEYLVNKNEDDELLKEIYDLLLRNIRHFYNNRINIPSVAISTEGYPMCIAPPKSERRIPIASGVDRGAIGAVQIVTPASVLLHRQIVIVADKCGHSVSWYRHNDLLAFGSNHHKTADNPVSLTVFKDFLFVCYTNGLVQFSFSWNDEFKVADIDIKAYTPIVQCCCVASNSNNLFIGTLTPSLILINTDTLRIEVEYPLDVMHSHTNNKIRHPWLQDMKTTNEFALCLFTGSPFPIQMFSLEGKLIKHILTEDQIKGAYHFNMFCNPVTNELRIYITDFWDNAIKVFDLDGNFIERFSKKGFELGQILHPTGIFVEDSGLIIVCDMKEDNCLQIF